ncbi:MAG: recombination protein RmuC, partial [Actinomycetota bacterium]|nr:recombination protein RmuC [Actinomycetota bacterium]
MPIRVTPLPYLRQMEVVLVLVVVVLGVVVIGLGALVVALVRAQRADRAARARVPEVPLDLVIQEAVADRAAADRAAMSGAVEQLVRMNQEMMDAERRLGTQELDGTRGLIDQQMGNMRVELAKLTGLLHEVERERREHVGELSSQLREAGRHTQVLAETTQSLREALSSTTARGQWGERMAEDVLRLAGFIDGVNYRKQQALAGSGGIPDYTFLLPQGLCLHMDVKFPLNNYMRFLDASSDAERERLRKEFLRDVR